MRRAGAMLRCGRPAAAPPQQLQPGRAASRGGGASARGAGASRAAQDHAAGAPGASASCRAACTAGDCLAAARRLRWLPRLRPALRPSRAPGCRGGRLPAVRWWSSRRRRPRAPPRAEKPRPGSAGQLRSCAGARSGGCRRRLAAAPAAGRGSGVCACSCACRLRLRRLLSAPALRRSAAPGSRCRSQRQLRRSSRLQLRQKLPAVAAAPEPAAPAAQPPNAAPARTAGTACASAAPRGDAADGAAARSTRLPLCRPPPPALPHPAAPPREQAFSAAGRSSIAVPPALPADPAARACQRPHAQWRARPGPVPGRSASQASHAHHARRICRSGRRPVRPAARPGFGAASRLWCPASRRLWRPASGGFGGPAERTPPPGEAPRAQRASAAKGRGGRQQYPKTKEGPMKGFVPPPRFGGAANFSH